jgi:hypothetical protein
MAQCTDQPPQGFVGSFLVGQRLVGDVKWSDATCGVPICAQAICGMWWAYLCPAGFDLGAEPPVIRTGTADIQPAGLALGAVLPTLKFSQAPPIPAAGLVLGSEIPIFVGQTWLNDEQCSELVLSTDPETPLTLTVSSCASVDLTPAGSR